MQNLSKITLVSILKFNFSRILNREFLEVSVTLKSINKLLDIDWVYSAIISQPIQKIT